MIWETFSRPVLPDYKQELLSINAQKQLEDYPVRRCWHQAVFFSIIFVCSSKIVEKAYSV